MGNGTVKEEKLRDRWSNLIQLKVEHLENCVSLQDRMIERMKNKPHAYDYIRYRDKIVFSNMIEKKELFGVFNSQDILSSILSISECSTEQLVKYLEYEKPNKLVNLLLQYKASYFATWMTDLDPKNIGIGSYLMKFAQHYASEVLGYDFCIGSIHTGNLSAHRGYTRYYPSFGIAHKMMSIKNVNRENKNTPVFYIVVIFNVELSKKIYDMINLNQNLKINPKGSISDYLLNNNEVLVLKDNRIFKCEIRK